MADVKTQKNLDRLTYAATTLEILRSGPLQYRGAPAFAGSFGWSAEVLFVRRMDEGGHPHGSALRRLRACGRVEDSRRDKTCTGR